MCYKNFAEKLNISYQNQSPQTFNWQESLWGRNAGLISTAKKYIKDFILQTKGLKPSTDKEVCGGEMLD